MEREKACNFKTTDCTVNTRDLYKGLNLPRRFECPCKKNQKALFDDFNI